MKLVLFTKCLRDHDVSMLIDRALDLEVEGYDLCVRPGYPVHPDNAATALPEAVRLLAAEGFSVPMVTGNFDLLLPDNPGALPLLAAMDEADVRILKLGYFMANPVPPDYWAEVDRIRRALEGWQELGKTHRVRICYHTHSGLFMGGNCAALMHLLSGFDPEWIGAYLDPGHLVVNGEPFPLGRAMVGPYLAAVGLKDVLVERRAGDGEGAVGVTFVEAGKGMVGWSAVFDELKRTGFSGPLSLHAEYGVREQESMLEIIRREVAYFRERRGVASYAPPL